MCRRVRTQILCDSIKLNVHSKLTFYRPQRSCDKVRADPLGIYPPGRQPPGQTPPWADTPMQTPTKAADGTHPTGMHSFLQDMLTLYVHIEMFDRVKYRTIFLDVILFLLIETYVTHQ